MNIINILQRSILHPNNNIHHIFNTPLTCPATTNQRGNSARMLKRAASKTEHVLEEPAPELAVPTLVRVKVLEGRQLKAAAPFNLSRHRDHDAWRRGHRGRDRRCRRQSSPCGGPTLLCSCASERPTYVRSGVVISINVLPPCTSPISATARMANAVMVRRLHIGAALLLPAPTSPT